jgi:hypothetical protein
MAPRRFDRQSDTIAKRGTKSEMRRWQTLSCYGPHIPSTYSPRAAISSACAGPCGPSVMCPWHAACFRADLSYAGTASSRLPGTARGSGAEMTNKSAEQEGSRKSQDFISAFSLNGPRTRSITMKPVGNGSDYRTRSARLRPAQH